MREKFHCSCSKPNAFSNTNFERMQELDACTRSGAPRPTKARRRHHQRVHQLVLRPRLWLRVGPCRHTCDARSCNARRNGRRRLFRQRRRQNL